ncbi:MAG: NAD(P)-dependent oxidoreductase [Paracoccus sp. (in: a-proteobacteria)]|uniref:NAD-dependent epimerase/dehydratase family protein n=1 Tax=Paracoccus sp. TaxID=267 RepID=UPI0026DF666A|nr:NAD(P)-dependent oxidoreductase [Paracoccus sp. (in: a-proteobacteria)]MDO5632101.1 NAD(P)-dependent oxidoreductase [Paracoccus sp. (in: a-proteobacteria)]
MRVALTGATGRLGGMIAPALAAAGYDLNLLPGWRLGDTPDLRGTDALVHLALSHAPGRYRGGEGDDPAGFRAANLDGTLRLWDAAIRDGVGRVVFLSSRAVHDGHPPGMRLPDDLPPAPTSLYGQIKAQAESALAALPLHGTSLRATGVYGPGRAHKWAPLFADFLAGQPIEPHVATELHGDDLAAAIALILRHPAPPATLNASDLVLDRRDLLAEVAALTGCRHPLPARADASGLRVPDCTGLAAMGWHPGGITGLRASLPGLICDIPAS